MRVSDYRLYEIEVVMTVITQVRDQGGDFLYGTRQPNVTKVFRVLAGPAWDGGEDLAVAYVKRCCKSKGGDFEIKAICGSSINAVIECSV